MGEKGKSTMTQEAMNKTDKCTKQVKKETGLFYHHNLDPISFAALQEASANLKTLGTPVSHSVIVRRALRLYCTYTGKLDETKQVKEGYELLKASKGTM